MPKSTYYQSFHKKPNSYHVANEKLLARIRVIHKESDGRYGAPKIFQILKQEGYTGSIDRVQRIMRKAGIRSNITKKYRPTPTQKPVEGVKTCWDKTLQPKTSMKNGWQILRISTQ